MHDDAHTGRQSVDDRVRCVFGKVAHVHDAARAVALFHRLQADGKDPVQLARDLLGYLRKLLIYNVCQDPRAVVAASDIVHDRLSAQAGRLKPAESYRMVRCIIGRAHV